MLETIELFSHLQPRQLEALEQISIIRQYENGEILFYQGEESNFFHVLLKGEVSIFKSTPSNELIRVHRFRAPSMIAEVATLKSIPYPASAECVGESTLLKIQRDPFIELLHQDAGLGITLISSLMEKIGALELSLQRFSAPNVMAKVARLLLDDPDVLTRMKSIEVASILNTTPETLSRMLKKLKNETIIDYKLPKFFAVLNQEGLLKYAEIDSTDQK